MTDANSDLPEVRLDKFRIERRLGQGGMGTVYEGYDVTLGRRVAIKTLTSDAISNEDARARFEREARAAAQLDHQNIVTVYELGNFGGNDKPYIVMEHLEGIDLSDLIRAEKQVNLGEALSIVARLCRALDFAHQHNVVHRDVKPSNVRCLDDGRVKIMDFGIARMEGATHLTQKGMLIGTLQYMAPEQVQGLELDGRADLFSAACILYEMLAGELPFTGDNLTAIVFKIVHGEAKPILEHRPDLPEQIGDILGRAMAKEPDQRYATAGELADELNNLADIYAKSFPRLLLALEGQLKQCQ